MMQKAEPVTETGKQHKLKAEQAEHQTAEERRKAALEAKRQRQSERELAARVESVRGIKAPGRSQEALEKDAKKYQQAHEDMVLARARELNKDNALKRIQGLDGSVPKPERLDSRQQKMRGNQVQKSLQG